MKLNNGIDYRVFIRLGPMSGQKQTHKGIYQAPAKKGIWLLPIQAKKHDLCFLGGYNTPTNRLKIKEKDYEKHYGISYTDFCKLPYEEMERLENIDANKQMKKQMKKIKLKKTDFVWTHLGKGAPDKEFGGSFWYEVTVDEYWKLFKQTFSSTIKKGYSIDGEWAEVFWETT